MKGENIMEKKKKILSLIAIGVGIIAILLGIYFLFVVAEDDDFYGTIYSYNGAISKLGTMKFGADFYTEVYKAAAFSGNAISGIYHVVCYAIGAFFIMGGIIDICCFIPKILKEEKIEAKEE